MLRETEVDGVHTLIVPATGPMRAGLTFRVGRADETLASSGITHLVEHLALFRHGLSDYHYNGATGPITTHFHVEGAEDVVAGFLTAVGESLTDLPLERLATETSIVRTEAAGRPRSNADQLPLWRYGARTYGLLSYEELGLSRLSAEDLSQWVATWFTRENAVLWIAGDDVPAGLKLDLPSGERRPVPAPSSALPVTPAYALGPAGGVAYDTVVRRRVAASLYVGVLERELFRQLRQEGGYSYAPRASYESRGDGYAVITAVADALPDKYGAVLGGVLDVLAQFQFGRIAEADVDAVRTKAIEALRHPELEAAWLPRSATNVLTGHPNPTPDEFAAQLRAVTLADVQEVAREAAGSALVMAAREVEWAGYAPAPTGSPAAVPGRRFASLQGDDQAIVVGPAGVSAIGDGAVSTVRFDACSAALAWPDGARQLIGHDAMQIRVEPTLIKDGAAAVAAIDAGLDPHLVLPRPARAPDRIPQPEAPTKPARPRPSGVQAALSILCIVAASVVGCIAAICTLVIISADPATNPDDADFRSGSFIATIVLLWLFVAVMIGCAVRVRRPSRSDPPHRTATR
jgi:zinc protease